MKTTFVQTAGILLAVFFAASTIVAQTEPGYTYYFERETPNCEPAYSDYMQTESDYVCWFGIISEEKDVRIKKLKVKGINLKAKNYGSDSRIMVRTQSPGDAGISVKAVTFDGEKITYRKIFTVIEMPHLDVEIQVTDPHSKFMWLNIYDTNTGQPANSSFDLCKVEFELYDSLGKPKEWGISCAGDEFFPSVTLRQLATKFALKDQLKLDILINHVEYGLSVQLKKELTITKLWN